jgi:predicted PurR-regulated permease PerM
MLGLTFGLFGAIVNLVVVVVLSIYWSIDRVHFERLWLSLLAVDVRLEARDIWRAIETESGEYLRSEFVQSAVAGVVLGIGFWLIGLPYPVVLGLVGAFAWFIPWVGMMVAVIAVGVLSLPTLVLMSEPTAAIRFVAAASYTLIVLLLLELVIEPRLFNRRRYNSLLIAVVVIGLAQIVGVLGLILGPPLAAAIQILFSRLLRRRAMAIVAEGTTPASFTKRIAALQTRIATLPQPSPELNNLAGRLATLIEEAEELAPMSAEGRANSETAAAAQPTSSD